MAGERRIDLRSELEALKRRAGGVFGGRSDAAADRFDAPPPVPEAPRGDAASPVTDEQIFEPAPRGAIELLVRGEQTATDCGPFYRIREHASAIWERGSAAHAGYIEALASPPSPMPAGCDPMEAIVNSGDSSVVYLDIETAGLRGAPLFLIGLMYSDGAQLVIDQLFARDYTEEQAVLCFLAERLGSYRVLVTFNGVRFDVPFISERSAFFGLPMEMPRDHVDLLPVSRALMRGRTPDHRLQTLERFVLGRKRTGDIPGSEIPGAYHDFVRTGEASRMAAVIHHNRLDLLSMLELVTIYLSHA